RWPGWTPVPCLQRRGGQQWFPCTVARGRHDGPVTFCRSAVVIRAGGDEKRVSVPQVRAPVAAAKGHAASSTAAPGSPAWQASERCMGNEITAIDF
ncbi:MAG: hypothetical protein ABIP03_09465, partial [Aquihabitans sp.]